MLQTFCIKPGCILSAPDTLSRIAVLHVVDKNQALLEAKRLAQEHSANWEFIYFRHLATHPKSDFQVTQGLIDRKMSGPSPLFIHGNASGLCQKVLEKLYTSPLGGHLGYCKLLGLIHTHFWWLHLTALVQEFCCQCLLCQ